MYQHIINGSNACRIRSTVRKRRKCRPGDPCRSKLEQTQGAPAPPEAKDPPDFSMPNLPN
eukprot:2791909-Prymnesium_polylepis.1